MHPTGHIPALYSNAKFNMLASDKRLGVLYVFPIQDGGWIFNNSDQYHVHNMVNKISKGN